MCSSEEFFQIIVAKSLLINSDADRLIEMCKDKEVFLDFISYIDCLLDYEPTFFLFDEITDYKIKDKILSLISNYRFTHKEKENVELYNSVIGKINEIYYGNNYSDDKKQTYMEQYFLFQMESRKAIYENIDDMFYAMSYDVTLYSYLINNDSRIMNIYDSDSILSSINYFMYCFPELFTNQGVNSRSEELLNTVITKSKILSKTRKHAIDTKNNFINLKD